MAEIPNIEEVRGRACEHHTQNLEHQVADSEARHAAKDAEIARLSDAVGDRDGRLQAQERQLRALREENAELRRAGAAVLAENAELKAALAKANPAAETT